MNRKQINEDNDYDLRFAHLRYKNINIKNIKHRKVENININSIKHRSDETFHSKGNYSVNT